MIIKLRTVDKGWAYFPINKKGFKVRKLTKEQWKNVRSMKDGLYLEVNHDAETSTVQLDDVYVINIHDYTCIYTNQIAYLLNDEGKTIEKII